VERGETVIVGVNKFADDSTPPVIPSPDYTALEREQVARVRAVRARRDEKTTGAALASLREIALRKPATGIMESIIDAVRARATVGEIADSLRECWGAYRPA
jgi:methylmalonyl-CoA mutase N-terminal domain/subunit